MSNQVEQPQSLPLTFARYHDVIMSMLDTRDSALRSTVIAATALLLLLCCSQIAPAAAQTTGMAKTTRYWDCCKASASWPGKLSSSVSGKSQAATCAKDGVTKVDPNTQNVCGGGGTPGPAYMCASYQPYAVNSKLSFGFAAATIQGKTESQTSCACYELKFTSGPVTGKTFVAQVINLGGDLGSNHFDLLIPGGGVGIFNGCQNQYGAPADGWGARYGGVSSVSNCSQLPAQLQSGCNWRFNWFSNADNPTTNLRQVKCPNSIVARSYCRRGDEANLPSDYAAM